jgi:hypothetical protein
VQRHWKGILLLQGHRQLLLLVLASVSACIFYIFSLDVRLTSGQFPTNLTNTRAQEVNDDLNQVGFVGL